MGCDIWKKWVIHLHGVHVDVVVEILEALLALLSGHVQSERDRVGNLLRVVRIDEERARAERLRGARELGEHEHARRGGGLLARHVLKGDEVHAVAERGDEHDVGAEVERAELIEGHRLVEVVDRNVLESAEAAVDARDETVDVRAELLVAVHLSARRHCDLQEDELAPPLWVLLEEVLDRLELVGDALDVVEPVDAEEHFLAVEAPLEVDDLILDGRRLETRCKLGWVDADGECVDTDRSPARVIEDALVP